MNLVQTIFEHVLESRWLKWIREVKFIGHEYDLERDEYIFQLNFH